MNKRVIEDNKVLILPNFIFLVIVCFSINLITPTNWYLASAYPTKPTSVVGPTTYQNNPIILIWSNLIGNEWIVIKCNRLERSQMSNLWMFEWIKAQKKRIKEVVLQSLHVFTVEALGYRRISSLDFGKSLCAFSALFLYFYFYLIIYLFIYFCNFPFSLGCFILSYLHGFLSFWHFVLIHTSEKERKKPTPTDTPIVEPVC